MYLWCQAPSGWGAVIPGGGKYTQRGEVYPAGGYTRGSYQVPFAGGGVGISGPGSLWGGEDIPTPLLTSSGGHQSEWYAFYWNAFLLQV